MLELTENMFEALIGTSETDYLSYLELLYAEGETVEARFMGEDVIMLFTNKRIISFNFPTDEDGDARFRQYQFIPYKSVQHYSFITGVQNVIIGFEMSVAGMDNVCIASVSQLTVIRLMELINQYTA